MSVSVGTDLAMRHQRSGRREQTRPLVAAGGTPPRRRAAGGTPTRLRGNVHDAHTGQIQSVEQRAMIRIGEQYLAVGAHDVFGQRRAATGVVDAAQHVATECGRRHRGEHLRCVAQQRADVQRALAVGDADQCGGGRRGIRQMLTPGPDPIAVFDRGRGVAKASTKQLLNSVRHGSPLSRRSTTGAGYRRSVGCKAGRAMLFG